MRTALERGTIVKSHEQKTEFIQMRAAGNSYAAISKKLHISKDTCHTWEKELKKEISKHKGEQLNELYTSYYMTRAARIKKLGDTLSSINSALDSANLTEIPPEKLLDYKLKYTDALKSKYIDTTPIPELGNSFGAKDIMGALGNLLDRIKAGEVTNEQAARESLVISNLLKAYDAVELKTKVDTLEAIVGGRG